MIPSPNFRVKHVLCNSKYYHELEHKEDHYLYFIEDTNEIYKGNDVYSNAVSFVNEFPTIAAVGKFYVDVDTLEARVWDGKEWRTMIPEVLTELTDEEQNGLVSASAIKAYTIAKIKEIIAQGATSNTDLVTLTQDITVKGQPLGMYNEGDVIPTGETLTNILINSLRKRILPEYKSPELSLDKVSQKVETGTRVKPVITPTFTRNDGGDLIKFNLLRRIDENELAVVYNEDMLVLYTEKDPLIVTDGNSIEYTARVNYADGEPKEDNLGDPDPDHMILAGELEASFSYTGLRKLFFTSDTEVTKLTTSEEIRNIEWTFIEGESMKINIPISAGDTRVIIAYPSKMNDISSIISNMLHVDVLEVFEKSTVEVYGAENNCQTEYKVYTFIPKKAFGNNEMYTVTI